MLRQSRKRFCLSAWKHFRQFKSARSRYLYFDICVLKFQFDIKFDTSSSFLFFHFDLNLFIILQNRISSLISTNGYNIWLMSRMSKANVLQTQLQVDTARYNSMTHNQLDITLEFFFFNFFILSEFYLMSKTLITIIGINRLLTEQIQLIFHHCWSKYKLLGRFSNCFTNFKLCQKADYEA